MSATAILLVVSVAVGGFLTVILAFSHRGAPRLLAAFTLLLTAISFLQLMVALKSIWGLFLPFLVFPAIFLHGLIIDSYTRSLLRAQPYRGAHLVVLCFPAVAAFCAQISVFVLYDEFRNIEAVSKQHGLVKTYTATIFILALAYNLVFIGRARRKLPPVAMTGNNRNALSQSNRYRWLKLFLAFNAVLCLAGLINVIFNLLAHEPAPVNPLMAVLFSGGNYLILTFLIRRPAILSGLEMPTAQDSKGKYAKIQSVDEATRREYAQRIQSILATEEAYLDDSFSLNDLSEQLKLPPHLVSMVINVELQQNFYTLVNSYRVEKAKQLLVAETSPNILEVAYASGFQSKSAFNRVFKQFTGQTPSAFRNA